MSTSADSTKDFAWPEEIVARVKALLPTETKLHEMVARNQVSWVMEAMSVYDGAIVFADDVVAALEDSDPQKKAALLATAKQRVALQQLYRDMCRIRESWLVRRTGHN